MKKVITLLIGVALALTSAVPCYGAVDGITKDNYDSWVKTTPAPYGYNKGECEKPYLEGEEYFYNDCYDHWNVDLVYDESLIPSQTEAPAEKTTNLTVAKKWAKSHYKGYKVKVVGYGKVPSKRKGKKTVYIETMKTKSDGGKNGHVIKDHSYVKYAKKISKGKVEVCYAVWSPKNNACDGIVAFVSCKTVK